MLIHGDSAQKLKELPDNSVDLICTDPPYGYSFMGKDWDKAVPSVEIWKECLRALKPGAFAFIMSAPRSDVLSRMIVRIEDAGFRVDFTPIYWTYSSGFPKAMNIGKMVDKRLGHIGERIAGAGAGTPGNTFPLKPEAISPEAISPEAISLDGSYGGFQPKPAIEVIIVAMKPLSEKTFVDQALKNGHGITWLDSCRIPTLQGSDLNETMCRCGQNPTQSSAKNAGDISNQDAAGNAPSFAPAIADTHGSVKTPGTPQDGTTKTDTSCSDETSAADTSTNSNMSGNGNGATAPSLKATRYTTSTEPKTTTDTRTCNACGLPTTDASTQKELASEENAPVAQGRFPANLLVSDDVLNDGRTFRSNNAGTTHTKADGWGHADERINTHYAGDTGSYSRYFSLDAWWTEAEKKLPERVRKVLPFMIVPKASKREKNEGCARLPDMLGGSLEGGNDKRKGDLPQLRPTKNGHPTVKPLQLMSYLVTLGSRQGDTVLDPFLGSGTTAIAAKLLNRRYIGIEREKEYLDIAKARLDATPNTLFRAETR